MGVLLLDRLLLAAALFFVGSVGVAIAYSCMAFFGAPRVLPAETQVVAGVTAVIIGLFFSRGGRRA